jgi:hypothetical protein
VWERLRDLWPLTLRGAGVLSCAAGALWLYGFRALDGVWYVAGVGLIGLCAAALLAVLAAAARVALWRRDASVQTLERAGVQTETRRAVETGFRLPRLRFWALVEVRVSWLEPDYAEVEPRAEGALLGEQVRLWDHGELRSVVRRIELRDVFGLAAVALRRRAPIDIATLPHAGALRSQTLLRSFAGGDDLPHPLGIAQGDRLELRRYAPGDPARFIHWKVYARTQKLVVRMPERALSRAQRVAAFLVAGEGDGPSAAAARVALEETAFGSDFCFGADGSPEPARNAEQALTALRRSSAARERSGADLNAFVATVEKEGPASYVLFVPPRLGATVDAVRRMAMAQHHPVRVVIGIDGIRADEPAWWQRIALQDVHSARIPLAELREVLAAYKGVNCELVVVDRESGRALGDAHLEHAARAAAASRSNQGPRGRAA